MGKRQITDLFFYRWRFILSYVVLAIILVGLLAIAGLFVPGGLAKPEMASASHSLHVPLAVLNGSSPEHILHLPYHALQQLSITLFGMNNLAIKLPSLMLAGLSIMALFGVVRLWFRRNVAIITSLIAVTSAQFLLLAQLGTPEITYIFWPAAILFTTSMLAHSAKYRAVWLVAATILAGLSLYSPLGLYLIIALGLISLIHPHARFIVFSQSKILLGICVGLFALMVTPLVLNLSAQPQIGLTLLGLANIPALTPEHLQTVLLPYVAFYAPSASLTLQPVFGLAAALLAILGAVRLFTAKYTAKSYIISLMFVFVFVGIILGSLPPAYTFVPVILLVAFGMHHLITSWYRLFPFNPYARIAALFPLAVLVVGVSFTELERYFYSYHYTPQANVVFTQDLKLLDNLVQNSGGARVTILVPASDKQFYTDYAQRLPNSEQVTVTSDPALAKQQAQREVIIVSKEYTSTIAPASTIAVSSRGEDAARFYLYKNDYR